MSNDNNDTANVSTVCKALNLIIGIAEDAFNCPERYREASQDRALSLIADVARAALSVPARNCDRFATLDEARKAFQEARGHKVLADVELWDSMDEAGALVRWLFAPAEGGAK